MAVEKLMNIEEKIKAEAVKLGLDMCGITNASGKSIVVCLFPYYLSFKKSNISRYAAVVDYHIISRKYLEKLAQNAKLLDYEIYADISPYNERQLAYNAGLGVKGKNGLLINKKYGSYIFIGLIVLNSTELKSDTPLNEECLKCGNCLKNCPGGALSDSGSNINKCISELTQKKGELSEAEKKLIIKTGSIWGCDICSEVCPMNKDITETPLPEFKENIISSLYFKDLDGLSNKEFIKKYSDRAFTWRGKKVLIRNCGVLENCQPVDNF